MGTSRRTIKSLNIFEILEQEQALMKDLNSLPAKEYRERLEYHAKLIERLYNFAIRDPLTKLLNRNAYDAIMTELVRNGQQQDFVHALFDIDLFKAVNDTYGHGVGDEVLVAVAQGIRKVVGNSSYSRGFAAIIRKDHSARYGGEEFVVAYPRCSIDEGVVKAEKLRKSVAAHVASKGLPPVSLSAGITSLEGVMEVLSQKGRMVSKRDATEGMYAFADYALYCAKEKGRNRLLKANEEILSAQSTAVMGKLGPFVDACWRYRNQAK